MASQYVQPQPNIGGPRMPYMSNAAAWDRPPRSLHSSSSGPSPPRRYLPPSQALRQHSPTGAQAYYETSGPADAWTTGRPRGAVQPLQIATHLAPPPPPAAAAQQQWIKCSSCSEMVELEELGDHVCQAGRNLRSPKVDVDGGERSARLRVTNPDRDYDNSENQAAPRAPALSIPRSPVSPAPTSATSTSRLPFFERYQKMVDTNGSNNEAAAAAGQVGSAIPRSPRLALANLSQPSYSAERSPRLAVPDPQNATMSTSRSEPLLSPPAPSYPVRKNSLPRPRSPHGEAYQPFSDSPQAQEDRDEDRSRQAAPSQSPSRGKLVESTYLAYAAFDDDDDDNEDFSPYLHSPHQHHTLTASYSSPADLAGLTVPSTPASYTSRPRDDPASPSGLDACLADLQLLAEDDAVVDEGAAGLMIRGFGDTQDAHSPILGTEQQPPQPLTARSPTPRSRRLPTRQDSFEIRQVPSHLAHQVPITCAVCRAPLATANDLCRAGDGQAFCRPCYADRFLPKCRKCCKPIEGGAVTSSDGKVTGKYHADCFGCFGCSAKFPDGEFYVFDGKPYCQNDYHALNGSLCAAADCGRPIEGSCVSLIGEENGGGGRYHPTCFNCSEPSCRRPLLDFHYIVGGRPFCDEHFSGAQRFCPPWDASVSAARSQAERSRKRQTIVTWR